MMRRPSALVYGVGLLVFGVVFNFGHFVSDEPFAVESDQFRKHSNRDEISKIVKEFTTSPRQQTVCNTDQQEAWEAAVQFRYEQLNG